MNAFNAMLARFQPAALSLLRIITGLLLFQYGVAKVLKFPIVPPFDKVAPWSLFWCAGMIELVLGGLLILGFCSRIVAFVLCGEMAFAYFIAHFPRNFIPILNGGENAIMFCFCCLYIFCAGGGPYGVDGMMGKKA